MRSTVLCTITATDLDHCVGGGFVRWLRGETPPGNLVRWVRGQTPPDHTFVRWLHGELPQGKIVRALQGR